MSITSEQDTALGSGDKEGKEGKKGEEKKSDTILHSQKDCNLIREQNLGK